MMDNRAERVIEALGREPPTTAEMILECKVGEMVPLECFQALPTTRKMRVPVMQAQSIPYWGGSPAGVSAPPGLTSIAFERTDHGWVRIE